MIRAVKVNQHLRVHANILISGTIHICMCIYIHIYVYVCVCVYHKYLEDFKFLCMYVWCIQISDFNENLLKIWNVNPASEKHHHTKWLMYIHLRLSLNSTVDGICTEKKNSMYVHVYIQIFGKLSKF